MSRFSGALFLASIALATVTAGVRQASADARIIVYGGSTKGCAVKGVIRATFEPSKTEGSSFFGKSPPIHGIANNSVIDDLKRQAAALDANRIVIRDAISEGSRSFHPRAGASAEWYRTTIIAEAVKC